MSNVLTGPPTKQKIITVVERHNTYQVYKIIENTDDPNVKPRLYYLHFARSVHKIGTSGYMYMCWEEENDIPLVPGFRVLTKEAVLEIYQIDL